MYQKSYSPLCSFINKVVFLGNSTDVWQFCQNWANDTIGRIITTLTCDLSHAFLDLLPLVVTGVVLFVTYCSNWIGADCYLL